MCACDSEKPENLSEATLTLKNESIESGEKFPNRAPELYFAIQDTSDSRNAKTGRIAKGFMAFVSRSKDGEQPGEDALIARLRQLVEGSDLSFYKIASRVGTSGTTLSMWLAGTAKPHPAELASIEKFLKAE